MTPRRLPPLAFRAAVDDPLPRVSSSFARQGAMAHLGIALTGVGVGRAELSFPHDAALTQHHGYIHAGVLSTAMDSACGYAAYTLMPDDAEVLTIEFKANLLRPALGARYVALGEVLKAGRQVTVAEAKLRAFGEGDSEGDGTLVASMTATLMAVTR